LIALVLVLGLPWGLAAQAADKLDAVAGELESILTDLESAQAQTADLRGRLADLETLTAEHRATLADQDRRLAEYQASVQALEAHDKASLAVARDLQAQLETERLMGRWLWPVAAVAIAAAVVEGVVLGWRR
jgi:septal ring factor EnvC (AmiA/AmiB activator)